MSDEKSHKKTDVHPLDEELRRAFKNLVEEDLPDRFETLLEQLRKGAVTDRPRADGSDGDAPEADD